MVYKPIMNKIVKALGEIIKKEEKTVYSVAKAIDVDLSSLYRAFKEGGNPEAKTIEKILDHLGYEMRFIKSRKKGGEKR
jgi:probable addiction module antidote protein